VRKLLATKELGDRTPTQFWHHLNQLADNSVDKKFLTEIWKNAVFSTTAPANTITSDAAALIFEQIQKLQVQINALSEESRRPRNRDLCWYHDKFGANATKCSAPCMWKFKENGQGR
jgi:hypothetical protein